MLATLRQSPLVSIQLNRVHASVAQAQPLGADGAYSLTTQRVKSKRGCPNRQGKAKPVLELEQVLELEKVLVSDVTSAAATMRRHVFT